MEQCHRQDGGVQLDTIRNIWHNYLKSNDNIATKTHWLQLFLFHFQFIDGTTLNHEEFKSFFNSVPEEICSFFLAQVYEIISKSDLCSTDHELRSRSEDKESGNSSGDTNPVYSGTLKTKNLAKLVIANHNFTQLVLGAPSDCSKIVALRNFLTHQLGQHLLLFLLKVDIKLIASQKSLCNLCISLFPNCPWNENHVALRHPATMFEYVGKLVNYQNSKSKSFLKASQDIGNKNITIPDDEQKPIEDFEKFKVSTKTSDEIAFILIKLLTNCIASECETSLSEQSMSVIALNFAVDCLCLEDECFSSAENAIIIKCAFLSLVEQCLNNIFNSDENIHPNQFQKVLTQLASVLQSNCLDVELATGINQEFLYATAFLLYGTIYNFVIVYLNHSSNTIANKHNLHAGKFMDAVTASGSGDILKLLMNYDIIVPYSKDMVEETKVLFKTSFKTLIKIIDNLYKYEQYTGVVLSGNLTNSVHQKSRRKKLWFLQMHCQSDSKMLSCYFQNILLSQLPNLPPNLQSYASRYLFNVGTCCCHYTLATYEICLDVALQLSPQYQNSIYKFLHRKVLTTVFVRQMDNPLKKQRINCSKCDAKLKSLDFHAGILKQYRKMYEKISRNEGLLPLTMFLKHLKQISYLLTNDISAGVLAEIVLPIFRHHKAKLMDSRKQATPRGEESKGFWRPRSFSNKYSSEGSKPSTPVAPNTDATTKQYIDLTNTIASSSTDYQKNLLKVIQDCLNLFAIYLSDLRLIKAFYNEENINHLEELLVQPELIRGICDLIKIGIDNITFLGDNSQEQIALSCRLINLQLNSSNRAAQLFKQLLTRFSKSTRLVKEIFWFNDSADQHQLANSSNLKPIEILQIAALQWSLNFELLKTSQYFYNEFAKIYSIVVEDEIDPLNDASADTRDRVTVRNVRAGDRSNYLHHGDKTIIDILRLNYNALSAFLLLPPKSNQDSSNRQTERQHSLHQASEIVAANEKTDNAIDCSSSSLEILLSSLDLNATQSLLPSFSSSTATTTTIASTTSVSLSIEGVTTLDGDTYVKVTEFYDSYNGIDNTFLSKLKARKIQKKTVTSQGINHNKEQEICDSPAKLLLAERIVLFDIRNQAHTNRHTRSTTNPTFESFSHLHSTTNTDALTSLLTLNDPESHSNVVRPDNEGIIGKLFSVFGSLFGNSRYNSIADLSERQRLGDFDLEKEIDSEFLCFFEPGGDCKKLLLKLFEATMAICIKGFQNEEVEKMQKHLRKLKAVILNHAKLNWQQHSEEHVRENGVLQTLQTLLKIAELAQAPNEPVTVLSSGHLMLNAEDTALSISARPRVLRCKNGSKQQLHKSTAITPTTSNSVPASRPLSGESGDVDYFSTRASFICADSEVEFSENDMDEYYLTADEGYEADGEIHEISDSDPEIDTMDLWNSFQPSSRYRSHILHDGLCRIVVEILIELSQHCVSNPIGWSDCLVQLANRLYLIRDHLGGPLHLLRGFTPVLQCNDARLRELQQAILELIVDLNTPDVLCAVFGILSSKNPPVEILIKYMNYICTNSLKKVQPCAELEFPVILDGNCVFTSDPYITEHIERIRNTHLNCQTTTPFTRAPCVLPITHANFWSNDGFTLSLWLQVKSSQIHKSSSQLNTDDTRSTSEDYSKSHIVSLGTNQTMLSVYINNNMNLVFETCRPNAEIQTRLIPNDDNLESNTTDSNMKLPRGTTSQNNLNKTFSSYTTEQSTRTDGSHGVSQFRNALKHTKQVLLHSFSNMNLFNGHISEDSYYEGVPIDLKSFRLSKNRWTHLIFGVLPLPDRLELTVYVDGLEQHNLTLPFRAPRHLLRSFAFQLISLGDGVPLKLQQNISNCTESRSTLDGLPLRVGVSTLMLFNKKIDNRHAILNLTAMGPDFTELTQCQIASLKPNYGYINLSKMSNVNFGNIADSMKLLKESRVLMYSAQQPDMVMGYDPGIELDNVSYGRPYGLILYGELIQNQLQSLQTAIMLSGGLSTLLYLFARVVELTNNSMAQAMALDMLLSVGLSESILYAEFLRNDYMSLIGCIIKTERSTKDVHLLRSIINNACSQPLIISKGDTLQVNENTIVSIVYPQLITMIIHRYSDWHRSGAEHSDVLDMFFKCILALTREKHPHRDFNMEQLNKTGLVKELLNLWKVYVIVTINPVYISKSAAESFVSILSVFAGSPPSPSLMDEIMKLLLQLHNPSECYITHDPSKFYFLLTAELSAKEKSSSSVNSSRAAGPLQPIEIDDSRQARIDRLRKLHAKNSTYKRAINEFEENLENMADCSRLNKKALQSLSPIEVSKWRFKFKRIVSFNSGCSKRTYSPQKVFKSPSVACLNAANLLTQEKISRKRLHLHSATSIRSLHSKDVKKRKNSSLHSLPTSIDTFYHNYSERLTPGSLGSNESFSASGTQKRSRSLVKSDLHSTLGIVTLQEGLFRLLKDFLCLLPDNAVDEVLKHYVKVEFLLVLSNHSSCAVRAAIIRLLAALTKRLTTAELNVFGKSYYPHHLANQLSIYPSDAQMVEASIEWVNGVYGSLESILTSDILRIQNRFGLNALLAIVMKTVSNIQGDLSEKSFKILKKIYLLNEDDQQTMIEAGLLQCCTKALYSLYAKSNVINVKTESAIVDFLTRIGEKCLKSVGQMNIVWDILNMLSFYEYQDKQQTVVVRSFRSVQGLIQLNWISMFFSYSDPKNYKVSALRGSTLNMEETRTRLDLLIDRCCQFFTVCDDNYIPSENEIKLFQLLVKYAINTNQRYNNFIAWGLQPSRPRDLRAFIVDALWLSCQDDFTPSIICDGKMIKRLLWLCLVEDLEQPIENLGRLCQRLGINEYDSVWNLETELGRIEIYRSTVSAKQKSLLEKTVFKYEPLAVNCVESSMLPTRRVAELQSAERILVLKYIKDNDETRFYTKWLEIIRRMTHEGAPWFCKERYENFWELDSTEGPSRVHTRLRRCHLDIDRRFFMEDYQSAKNENTTYNIHGRDYVRPLDYLLSSYNPQLNMLRDSKSVRNFPAKYLPVDGEIDGEIVITDHKLYFLATYRCKYFYVSCDITSITEIWLKRYQHQEKAFEIFLDTNQSLFFSLLNQADWKNLRDAFCDKIVTPPDQNKVLLITQQWREGLLTNWEYLMTLNQIAGRTYNDLMQYPVFPWILSDYTSKVLNLANPTSFRKLDKPIAVQHEANEEHYRSNYTYMNNTMANMGSLILKPYHYSSHYSNSGTVLHFLVRVPPFTSYFLRYQDNNFDLPDRTFHALSTTWCLASRDSPTDVKELIPEFFSLPEMFENFERFNFGCRQSGERVEDVALPLWCQRDPRLFILIHRQALESEFVRNNLHNWIDLIFGYKQTGEAAVEAINVFHPATYSYFLDTEIADPIERKAYETMVKTYGQMPRQLFKAPHPASKPLNYCIDDKILPTVHGLRWGVYLGSPQLPKPSLGNIHKLVGAEQLVSFSSTNVVYGLPAKSCVMQGADTDTFNVISWGYDDRIVRIQPLNKMYTKPRNLLYNAVFDSITACGSDPNSNQLWFGHKSGRISVYKCCSTESKGRFAKSRQSYMRGLRLSYNSSFWKIGAKTTNSSDKPETEVNSESSGTSASANSIYSADSLPRESGAELSWIGPTVLVRHTDEITCISLSIEFKIAVSTGRDGIAVIWDLNDWTYIRTIARPAEIHHSPITLITISPTLGDIVTVHTIPSHSSVASQQSVSKNWGRSATEKSLGQTDVVKESVNAAQPAADECFEVTEENLDDFVNVSVNPNGKSILRLHSVNARYIQHIVHEERITAVCYSYIKEGVGVNVIATAMEGGIVRLWSSWNLNFLSEIVTGISNIRSISYSTHQHLVVLTKESHLQVWETQGLYGSPPKFPQIAYK